jgi:hypothetical protein
VLNLADLDGNGTSDQVFVKSTGGLGSLGPLSAHLPAPTLHHVYVFGDDLTGEGALLCPGTSSYFFGFASVFPPVPVEAGLAPFIEGPSLLLAARGPGTGVLRADVFAEIDAAILGLDPDDCVSGGTPGARAGRIGALHNRVAEAEALTAAGLLADASAVLANLRSKTDAVGTDWVRLPLDSCADPLRAAVDAASFVLSGAPLLPAD